MQSNNVGLPGDNKDNNQEEKEEDSNEEKSSPVCIFLVKKYLFVSRLNLQATSRKNTFLPPKELRLLSGVDHPRTYHARFIFCSQKSKQLSHASFRSSGFPGAFGRRNRDINVDSVAEFPTLGASVETVSFRL